MDAYRRMARKAGKIWREHGAVAYHECVADDVDPGKLTVPAQREGEARRDGVFAWIVYQVARAPRPRERQGDERSAPDRRNVGGEHAVRHQAHVLGRLPGDRRRVRIRGESHEPPAPGVPIPTDLPVWGRFFTVAPLVLVATRESRRPPRHRAEAHGDAAGLAELLLLRVQPPPRHPAEHRGNARVHGQLSARGADRPGQHGGRAARADDSKPSLAALATLPATAVDGVLVEDSYLWLECRLERIIDGFGDNSLIIGSIVAAALDERALRHSDSDDSDVIHASPCSPTSPRAASPRSARACRSRSPSTSSSSGAPPEVDEPGAKRILHRLRGQEGAMADLLQRLARAESPSLEPRAQAGALAILSTELEALGFAVDRVPGGDHGDHIEAEAPRAVEGAARQLLLGHLDTVWPCGTVERMPVKVEEGRVRGPGVFDMKGGLVQMLFALRALAEMGLEPSVRPMVFINSDEEIGSPELDRPHHAHRAAPSCGRTCSSRRSGRRAS